MEHTFEYVGHEEVWAKASPLSIMEIDILKQACEDNFIDLVCNQNTFGHMERWLIHKHYRELGIEKELVISPFGMLRPPTTIDPTNEKSIVLIGDILEQITSAIDSKEVNIGFDEPFELPNKRSGECVWY